MFYWQTDRPMLPNEFAEIFMNRHANVDEGSIKRELESTLQEFGFAETQAAKIEGNKEYKTGSVNLNRLILLIMAGGWSCECIRLV